ncbi:MAG: ADP-ribosylglycohydrolase family protein, partial [Duncaniella sp.]|nr:ADP-ribosylglycohydrolase family protein [Duncaniella sp.]
HSIYSGKEPMNTSKGCGGIMRVAPIGLYGNILGLQLGQTAKLAGEVAELTHLHPLSTYSSAALAVIVQLCIETDEIDSDKFKRIIDKAIKTIKEIYGVNAPAMADFEDIVNRALSYENDPRHDWEIIENCIGEGWVAEETLAIAVFSVLRHIDDFNACLTCAVNHGGDSDSTGAVAGNIIGAVTGYKSLPEKFTQNLQLLELILLLADNLCKINKNP